MPTPTRLPSELEKPLATREASCRAKRASIDSLTHRLEELDELIKSDDSIPEPINEDEDSLVYHVEVARPIPRDR